MARSAALSKGKPASVETITFAGASGATGRSYSSFDMIIFRIREKLLTLPGDTTVRTGHGGSTTIEAELPHLDEWIARGH